MRPLDVITKSETATPLTGSLKVTVKSTLAALVGFASSRRMEVTTGGVLSIVYVWPLV